MISNRGLREPRRHLKSHLVIAFARAAVGDRVRLFQVSDPHLMLGDQWPRKRRR